MPEPTLSDSTKKQPLPLLPRIISWVAATYGRLRPPKKTPASKTGPKRAAEASRVPAVPPLDPIEFKEKLWGPGFLLPGGPEFAIFLAKPFGLSSAMTMIDLTGGLGGPGRAISKHYNAYVTCLERSEEIARRGMKLSTDEGMEKKVPVKHYDPATFVMRPGGIDRALLQYLSFTVPDKHRLFEEVLRGLKPRGQIVITDFVLTEKPKSSNPMALDALGSAMKAWRKTEPVPPVPWTLGQFESTLEEIGFDIRITEDVSRRFKQQVTTAWDTLVQQVDLKSLHKSHLLTIVQEAELWMRRVAAIDEGKLKAYRFHAISKKAASVA
jgi:cyclopropane fatty-acyl-phospholipid synthase-like methyltransferase